MSNFNSREVAGKLSDVLNMHDHLRPGDDLIAHAAAILDSALLAANPGAGELADFAFVSGFNFGRKGFQTTGELEHENASRRGKAVSKIAAALESAKREEREKLRALMNGLECQHVDQFVDNASIAACSALGESIRKQTLSALAEKEGGR